MAHWLESYSLHILLVALFVVGFARDYFQRRAIDAGYQTIYKASLLLISPLEQEVGRQGEAGRKCKDELEELRVKVERLELGILTLITQLYKAGIRPDYLPPGWTVPPIN